MQDHESGTTIKAKKNSYSKAKIYQYDHSFNVVNSFKTITAAAQAVGVSGTSIFKAIHGERNNAAGYFWYKGEAPLSKIPLDWRLFVAGEFNKGGEPKKVRQLTKDGEVVAEYPSIGQAAKALGTHRDSIRTALNGKHKTCQGYKWEQVL